MSKQPELREQCKYGDLFSVEEFVDNVRCGGFIDYDGFGNLATAEQESRIEIRPSNVLKMLAQNPWATHVMWFNR